MWETFKAEFKHIWADKWRFAGYLVMLFIPFVYGFLYMNAYWAPFSHVDQLKIAVVSRDVDATGKNTKAANTFIETITKKGAVHVANQIYNIVEDESIANDPKAHVDNGEYAAIIVVPKGYSAVTAQTLQTIAQDIITNKQLQTPLEKHFEHMKEEIKKSDGVFNRVTVYNSFKHSYLAGEMTNFIAGAMDITMAAIESPIDANPAVATAKNLLTSLFKLVGGHSNAIADSISDVDQSIESAIETRTSGLMNSYGFGLAPYFISIALWAGALAMTFMIKNERHIKAVSTGKHLLGKWMVWLVSGWIQSVILITAVTLQGVNLGVGSQWQLYLFAIFTSSIFTSISMGIFYCFRYGDIGEFAVVILLVLQLISSSGTFPVEMQHVIFKIIHPVAPFTYSIETVREIFYDPDVGKILKNMAILIAFPVVIFPICYMINRIWDKKNFKYDGITKIYSSYEIHLGDF